MSFLVRLAVETGTGMDKDGTDVTSLPWTRHGGPNLLEHAITAIRTWERQDEMGSDSRVKLRRESSAKSAH